MGSIGGLKQPYASQRQLAGEYGDSIFVISSSASRGKTQRQSRKKYKCFNEKAGIYWNVILKAGGVYPRVLTEEN